MKFIIKINGNERVDHQGSFVSIFSYLLCNMDFSETAIVTWAGGIREYYYQTKEETYILQYRVK